MRLAVAAIRSDLTLPAFGPALDSHIAARTHALARDASLSAWTLLAHLFAAEGLALPHVSFLENGKPVAADSNLHFSLAHSGALCAALLADAPCGVDIESRRLPVNERLAIRCLTAAEAACGRETFYTFWTRKEALGKLSGRGIGAHPSEVDTLSAEVQGPRFYTAQLFDADGHAYILSAAAAQPPTEYEWTQI